MSVTFDQHGIDFTYIDGKGEHPITPRVNPKFAIILAAMCELLADHGFSKVGTYGVICNRLVRGSKSRTSMHSEGLKSNGYKHWADGSHGSLAVDIVYARCGDNDYELSVPAERTAMIKFMRNNGCTVYHTGESGDKKVAPDHLHMEWTP